MRIRAYWLALFCCDPLSHYRERERERCFVMLVQWRHTCHILPLSEIDLGLCLALFAGSGGKHLFHRIGWKGRIWQLCDAHESSGSSLEARALWSGSRPLRCTRCSSQWSWWRCCLAAHAQNRRHAYTSEYNASPDICSKVQILTWYARTQSCLDSAMSRHDVA